MTVTSRPLLIEGIRLGVPFGVADFLDGVAFGAVASTLHLGALKAAVFSALAFSGTAQYAALTVVSARGTLLGSLIAVAALNARYLFFGATIAPSLSPRPHRRLLEAQLLTDTSWALATRARPPSREILIGSGALSLIGWTLGTAIGAAAGSALPDYRLVGLDAVIPAFFLCLLLNRLHDRRQVARAACGAALAVALAPFVPPGIPLLIVLILAAATR